VVRGLGVYIPDISKAKKVFGFDPKVSFAEGVEKAVEWYGQNVV
jgi:nucleoside-diphosphate-sugar epimerase